MKWNWFMNDIRIKSKSMRKIIYILLSLCFLVACNEEDTLLLQKEGMGTLVLQGLEIESAVNDLQSRATLENVPTAGQFIVSVEDQATGVEYELGTGETQYALAAGAYKVKAQYGENIVSTDKPYYYGEADAVIEAGVQTTVTLTASLNSAIIRPVMDEQLLTQFKSYEIKVKTAEGTEYDVNNSEDLYVPSNKSYTLDFSGINQFDEEKSNTWTLSDLQARTRYLINCNADLPSFNFPMQAEINAWSKFIYITPMTEADITAHQEMADKILSNIVYEASADNNTWIPAEKKGDDWVIVGLEPSTAYTLRARFGGVISNNTQELMTESAQQIENGDMESWQQVKVANAYGNKSFYNYYLGTQENHIWQTNNEEGLNGATTHATNNIGTYWRWCAGTQNTSDVSVLNNELTSTNAAEISTLGFYTDKITGWYVGVISSDEIIPDWLSDGNRICLGLLYLDKTPFNSRPSSISFDYKYIPVTGDSAPVEITLYDSNKEELWHKSINLVAQTEYQAKVFSIDHQILENKKVSFISVHFQSGTNTDYKLMHVVEGDYNASPRVTDRVVGSVLKIDNVTLNYDYEN